MNELLIAFLIGIASSGHCLMMCGGIASSLSSSVAQHAFWPKLGRTLLFHIGRISCYAMLGFVIGDVLRVAIGLHPSAVFYSRLLAGIMLIVIGLYITGFTTAAKFIEDRMAFVWKKLQPLVGRFIGAKTLGDAYAIGFLWGFLPCGILYTTLLWASSQTQAPSVALLMFCFGLGTIPSLFASSLFLQKLLTGRSKKIMGIAIIIFGLWSLAFMFMPHGEHATHSSPDLPEQSQMHYEHHEMH